MSNHNSNSYSHLRKRSRVTPPKTALVHLDGLATLATLNIATAQLGCKDSLIRNQAAAEVVLETQTDQERDNPTSPIETAGDTIAAKPGAPIGVVGNTDGHLDDLDDGPDKGADDIELDKDVDHPEIFPVCAQESVDGNSGDTEVEDSEDDKDGIIPANEGARSQKNNTEGTIKDNHADSNDHGTSVKRNKPTAHLELVHLPHQTTALDTININHHRLSGVGLGRVDGCGLFFELVRGLCVDRGGRLGRVVGLLESCSGSGLLSVLLLLLRELLLLLVLLLGGVEGLWGDVLIAGGTRDGCLSSCGGGGIVARLFLRHGLG